MVVERPSTPVLDLSRAASKRAAQNSPDKDEGSKTKKGKPRGDSIVQDAKGKGKGKSRIPEPEEHSKAGLTLELPSGEVLVQPRDFVSPWLRIAENALTPS